MSHFARRTAMSSPDASTARIVADGETTFPMRRAAWTSATRTPWWWRRLAWPSISTRLPRPEPVRRPDQISIGMRPRYRAAMLKAMTRSGSSPIGLAVALLGLGAGLAPGGCGGAEPSRGGGSALSRSPAHADGTEPGSPGIEPLDGREPGAEEDAAEEEAPPSEEAAPMDAAGGPKEVAFVELQSQQTAGARTIEPSRHDARAMETSGRGVVGAWSRCAWTPRVRRPK